MLSVLFPARSTAPSRVGGFFLLGCPRIRSRNAAAPKAPPPAQQHTGGGSNPRAAFQAGSGEACSVAEPVRPREAFAFSGALCSGLSHGPRTEPGRARGEKRCGGIGRVVFTLTVLSMMSDRTCSVSHLRNLRSYVRDLFSLGREPVGRVSVVLGMALMCAPMFAPMCAPMCAS